MSEVPIIHLTENAETNKRIIYFLQKVYHYYPVGFCDFRTKYPGFAEIKKIVQQKIDVECNDPDAVCNVFVDRVRAQLPTFTIQNLNHFNFPNYAASALISKVNNENFRQETYIEVYISLLCDYYTLFIADEYRFKNKNSLNNEVKDFHVIYSFKSIYGEQYDAEINIVKSLVHQFFPQKEFISHAFLNAFFVKQVEPFGGDECPYIDTNGYNFFDLLFHFNHKIDGLKVLD